MVPFLPSCKRSAAQLSEFVSYYHCLYFQGISSQVILCFLILVLTTYHHFTYSSQQQIASSIHPSFWPPPNHRQNHLKSFQITSFFVRSITVFLPSSLSSTLDALNEINLLKIFYLIQQHLQVWLLRNLW